MPASESQLLRGQMAGDMGFDPDAARREIAASKADLLKVTDPRDRANLQSNIDSLTQQLNNFGAPMETIDSAAGIGAFLNQAQAPQHLDSADAIGSFLGGKPAAAPVDTSDPAGNKDARDLQADAIDAGPSWLAPVRRTLASGMVPPARAALELTQPGVANAVARQAVPTMLGAPGDLINLAGNTVPRMFGQQGLGGRTGLPTSEDISHTLDRAGWQDQSKAHPIASQFGNVLGSVTPVGEAAKLTVVPGVRKVGSALEDYARGGQVGRDMGALGQDVTRTADWRANKAIDDARLPDQMPTPVKTRQGYVPPKPEDWDVVGLPGVAKGRPSAPQDIDRAFSSEATAYEKTLADQRTKVRKDWEAKRDANAPAVNMGDVIDDLSRKSEIAGPGEISKSYSNVLNDIQRVQNGPGTPAEKFEALDQIRRQLKDRTVPNAEGYRALTSDQAEAVQQQIGRVLKDSSEDYRKYTEAYRDVKDAELPFKSRFLKSLGENETSGSFMRGALKGPENVDRAIEALGGNSARFDQLASQHVVSELQGKTAAQIEKWGLQNEATLRKLPDTAKTVFEMQARAESQIAQKGIYERALKRAEEIQQGNVAEFSAAMGAQKSREAQELAARKMAHDLVPAIRDVQMAGSPKQQGAAMKSLLVDMHAKNMISTAEYDGYMNQLAGLQKSANRQAALQTMAKYLSYALTGNYLVSFGGPAAVKYAAAAAAK